ncbi:conserved hypothetical protein [Candidatus Roizmanbacteria bacterium]|nr:conserved hypothetical protein [Candidatus Roizmanbacteria bacterium]
MSNSLSCIIPFYNETDSLLKILTELSKIKKITQFICVDDGSTNNLSEKIQNKFPKILLMLLSTNNGKSFAVRKDIFQSGKRILSKSDLNNVLKSEIKGFELEVAINKYMMNNHKKVGWVENSSYNPHKIKKEGWVIGFLKDFSMTVQIISYIGLIDYVKQMIFFAKVRADS